MEKEQTITERWLERIDSAVKEGFAKVDYKLDQKADKNDVQLLLD